MKTILITFVLFSAISAAIGQTTPTWTQYSENGITVVEGSFWLYTFDNDSVLSAPALIEDAKAETTQQTFIASTLEECFEAILTRFGQSELDRIRGLLYPSEENHEDE